jgi:hypothetical protein
MILRAVLCVPPSRSEGVLLMEVGHFAGMASGTGPVEPVWGPDRMDRVADKNPLEANPQPQYRVAIDRLWAARFCRGCIDPST